MSYEYDAPCENYATIFGHRVCERSVCVRSDFLNRMVKKCCCQPYWNARGWVQDIEKKICEHLEPAVSV